MTHAEQIQKVIILGSGPAGYTAALYTARAGLEPLLIDGGAGMGQRLQGQGGQLTITTEVENYPGFEEGIMGPELMARMRRQVARFGVRFVEALATRLDLSERPFRVWVDEDCYLAQVLIVATGASAKWLGLEAEKPLWEGGLGGAGVSACATCDGALPMYRGKELMVVGGGDTAMEEAIYLTNHCEKVYVVHRRDELRASKIMQERAFRNPKIEFIWNTVVRDIYDVNAGKVTGVRLHNLKTDEEYDFPIDGVFIAIGHMPNTQIFQGILEMDEQGYIITRNGTYTSVEGVFAAGDVMDKVYRQAVTAAGTGCMAALDAERWLAAKFH